VTSGNGIMHQASGVVRIGSGVVFGPCATEGMRTEGAAATLYITAAYGITGGGAGSIHIRAGHGSFIQNSVGGLVFTVAGSPSYSTAFAYAEDRSAINFWGGCSYSGAATGTRYNGITNSVFAVGGNV